MRARIGTSGFQYRHWRQTFYPADVPQRRWLEYYAERFDTVEINATFYRLPAEEKVRGWRERVPAGFRFALKFSRYGSHIKRLKDPAASLDPFRAAVAPLGEQLGVVLLQLPPNWRAAPERLDAFLGAAPEFSWAVEFRDGDWFRDEVLDCLGQHRAALCLTDATDPAHWQLTADWTYLRFHGRDHDEPMGAERRTQWLEWAQAALPEDGGLWLYFNNDGGGQAPADARAFREALTDGA